jgi:hypothetical protein
LYDRQYSQPESLNEGKGVWVHAIRAYREVQVWLHSFFTSALDKVSGQRYAPCRFATGKRTLGTQRIRTRRAPVGGGGASRFGKEENHFQFLYRISRCVVEIKYINKLYIFSLTQRFIVTLVVTNGTINIYIYYCISKSLSSVGT